MIRLARCWEEGVLPEPGGVQDQAAWTVAAIDVVRVAWNKLRAAQLKKDS